MEHNDVALLCLGRLLSNRKIAELRVPCYDDEHSGAAPEGWTRAVAFFEHTLGAADLIMDAAQRKLDLVVAEQAAVQPAPNVLPSEGLAQRILEARGVMLEAKRAQLEVKDSEHGFKLLIQHLGECTWDLLATEKKLENLGPRRIFAIQDYKMKMLQVWFREASTRWYGKRGTSGHTTMLIFEREEGVATTT